MAAKTTPLTIALADIDVSGRVQPLDEAKAAEIATSVALHGGLFQPIGLRQTPKGALKWKLVFGRHRLRALELAGVAALIEGVHFVRLVLDAASARLIEIEENMARTDVSPFGRAAMLAAYRDASGKFLGPGGDRKSDAFLAIAESFTAHAMRVFDLSSDQIERLLRIGTALTKPEGLAERLHFSRIARNQSQLLKLAALPEEQLSRAAEAFDAAKGDFFNLMTILSRSPEDQGAMLGKLRSGATLADVVGAPIAQAPSFDHYKQLLGGLGQITRKDRIDLVGRFWSLDQKGFQDGLKLLGYRLVKIEGEP